MYNFLFFKKRPFGNLMSIKIWHDNSGNSGNDSSWYLKHIIIHDLQTREKSYFICEKWFEIDKEDCQIERVIPISLQEDKIKLNYLLSKQTKENFSDNHLWFSIFARPVQSSFTRLDRLTCCFVLLSISMLMNIMYYGMNNSTSQQQDGLKIGSYINLTLEQLSIGIITNLIVFPPTLLLVQLFRRIKPRNSRLSKLKQILIKNNLTKKSSEIKSLGKKSFELKFPWWFKIIAYILSFSFAAISIFFVIIKGIEFGNDKVTKWLTSLIISFVSSLLFTQPIQVNSFFHLNYLYLI